MKTVCRILALSLLWSIAFAQVNNTGNLNTAETWTAKQTFSGGVNFGTTPNAGNPTYVVSQTGIPLVIPASGYIDANGNVVIGQNPGNSATVTFSVCALTPGSTGCTVTCSATCFSNTSAGDVNRVVTVYTGTYYLTCAITAYSSATVATCTANANNAASLSSSAYSNANSWISGTFATTNTAYSGGSVLSVPMRYGYASAYLWFPTTSPVGTGCTPSPCGAAGWYYCTLTANSSLAIGGATTGVCYNNKITNTATPVIPASPTAFSGLTAATYTQQITATTAPVSISIAGNSMGINGELQVTLTDTYNNSAGTKTVQPQFGSTTTQPVQTSTATGPTLVNLWIRNAGSASVQVDTTNIGSHGVTPFDYMTYQAINTASNETLSLTPSVGVATDTVAIEGYSIKLAPN